jgi:hypothetical protein
MTAATLHSSRCHRAISLGWYPEVRTTQSETAGLHSRCLLDENDHIKHEAKGLAQFDYQRWFWFEGDRRAYDTDREDEYAWEL